MSAATLEICDARIAQLERSLRNMRWGLAGLLLLLIAFILVWYGVGGIVQKQVRVHRVLVVDAAGATRVRIGQDHKDTHRQSRASGVILYDSNGHERGGMATMANGRVAFGLDAPHVPAGEASDRIGMMVDGKGHVMFMAADGKGAPFVLMKAGDNGGTLQVTGMSADGKQLQVRTLGVDGDTHSSENGE